MDLTGKKILICEEALTDYKGHFYTWINAIRQMHLDAGAEVFVAGNREVVPEVKDTLQVRSVYSVNSWAMQSKSGQWPAWRRYMHVFVHNWKVFRETASALRQTGPVDIVMFTAVRIHHLIGLRLLCIWGLGRKFKRLVAFVLNSQAEYNSDFTRYTFPRQALLMKWVLRSFRRQVAVKQVVLAGDSHITCSEYEALAGVPMTLFPSPGAALNYQLTGGPAKARPATFAMLGTSTYDKGVDVFQAAIIRFLEQYPDKPVRFVLQWGVPCVTPDGQTIPIDPRLRASPQVNLIERRLTDKEYNELFSQADIIVLPYRKMTYFNRLSGVAVEAACFGKPMIVTKNTWLAWAMREFGSGLAVPEDGVEELCAALARCCAERDTSLATARERMAVARDYNSSERYLGILWGSYK